MVEEPGPRVLRPAQGQPGREPYNNDNNNDDNNDDNDNDNNDNNDNYIFNNAKNDNDNNDNNNRTTRPGASSPKPKLIPPPQFQPPGDSMFRYDCQCFSPREVLKSGVGMTFWISREPCRWSGLRGLGSYGGCLASGNGAERSTCLFCVAGGFCLHFHSYVTFALQSFSQMIAINNNNNSY